MNARARRRDFIFREGPVYHEHFALRPSVRVPVPGRSPAGRDGEGAPPGIGSSPASAPETGTPAVGMAATVTNTSEKGE